MSTKNSARYDKYIPLFGRNNDYRVRLFLDALFTSAEKNSRDATDFVQNDIKFKYRNNDDPYKQVPFTNSDDWMQKDTISINPHGINVTNNAIHSEWVIFFGQFLLRISSKTNLDVIYNKDNVILNIIKGLSGSQKNKSIESLMQLLIQNIFLQITDSNGINILTTPTNWSNASSFTVQSKENIFEILWMYNFITISNATGIINVRMMNIARPAGVIGCNPSLGVLLHLSVCLNAALKLPLYTVVPYNIIYNNYNPYTTLDQSTNNVTTLFGEEIFDFTLEGNAVAAPAPNTLTTFSNDGVTHYNLIQQDYPHVPPAYPTLDQYITLIPQFYQLKARITQRIQQRNYSLTLYNNTLPQPPDNYFTNVYFDSLNILSILSNVNTNRAPEPALAAAGGPPVGVLDPASNPNWIIDDRNIIHDALRTHLIQYYSIFANANALVGTVAAAAAGTVSPAMIAIDALINPAVTAGAIGWPGAVAAGALPGAGAAAAGVANISAAVDAGLAASGLVPNEYCPSPFSNFRQALIMTNLLIEIYNGDPKYNPIYKGNIQKFKQMLYELYGNILNPNPNQVYNLIPINMRIMNGPGGVPQPQWNTHIMNTLLPYLIANFAIATDKSIDFQYKYEKYYNHRLEEAMETPQQDLAVVNDVLDGIDVDTFLGIDTPGKKLFEDKYIRKSDGLLYKKEGSNYIPVHKDSDAWKSIKASVNCMNTDVKPTEALKCHEYLGDCLIGKNLAGCKDFLKNHEFWGEMKSDIDKMLPREMISTLEAFQFGRKNEHYKEINMNLDRFETYDEWAKHLESFINLPTGDPKKLDKTDYEAIINNPRLRQYLKNLVMKVNGNPSIININYNEDIYVNINNPTFVTEGSKYGVLQGSFKRGNNTTSNKKMQPFTNLDLSHDIANFQRLFTTNKGVALLATNISSLMTGGQNIMIQHNNKDQDQQIITIRGGSGSELIEKYTSHARNINSANVINDLYKKLLLKLRDIKKNIDPVQDKQIKDHIESLSLKELKLKKMLAYIDKYIILYENFGMNDDKSILTIDHIRKFAEKYDKFSNKTNDKRISLLTVLNNIVNSIQTITPEKETTTTNNTPLNYNTLFHS
jgi:hypothetical protein